MYRIAFRCERCLGTSTVPTLSVCALGVRAPIRNRTRRPIIDFVTGTANAAWPFRLLKPTRRRGRVLRAPGSRPMEAIGERTVRRCRSRSVTRTCKRFPVFARTTLERTCVICSPRALAAETDARLDDVLVVPAARRETVVLRLLVVVCVCDWAPAPPGAVPEPPPPPSEPLADGAAAVVGM